jgi:HK97 family phage major capsid protein
MKKVKVFAISMLSMLAFGVVSTCVGAEASNLIDGLLWAGGAGATFASLPVWFKMVDQVKTFSSLSDEEIKGLTAEERSMYYKASHENLVESVKGLKTEMENIDNDTAKAKNLESQLKQYEQMFEALKSTQLNQGELIANMKALGVDMKDESFSGLVKSAWDDAVEEGALKRALADKTNMSIVVSKATQTYGDVDSGEDFAQMRVGVIDQPIRTPKIRSLFPVTPLSTEFFKYVEQDSVIRDAQMAVKCAAITSTTKETLLVSSISTKVVKDMIDFCRLFVADYPFMQTRINRLINTSLALKVDSQLLLGDGTGENIAGIAFYSSEFAANNPACDIAASIQSANMVDLILGMQTQIMELGQQNGYDPNVVLVNKCDWFVNVESLKDLDNNYLDARVTMIGGTPFIGGMMVVWSPIVAQNTVYVMDTSKGEILDRQSVELDVAFENRDNWEKEIATLKGLERLNLLVPNEWKNAFMMSTDVAVAIAAITKP